MGKLTLIILLLAVAAFVSLPLLAKTNHLPPRVISYDWCDGCHSV